MQCAWLPCVAGCVDAPDRSSEVAAPSGAKGHAAEVAPSVEHSVAQVEMATGSSDASSPPPQPQHDHEAASKAVSALALEVDGEPSTGGSSAEKKRDALWEQLVAEGPGTTPYPDVKALTAYGREFDYSALLDYAADVQPAGRRKVICSAGGAVAPVRFEWRQQAKEHFSGLFRGADYGLMRCSSVIEPSAPSSWSPLPAMIPMVGLKFFRNGEAPSGNVLLAHKKSGGKDANFLKYAVSNHFTENVKYPFKAALAVFQKYSQFPTFTGLTDFASMTQDGAAEEKVVSPYALVLVPPAKLQARKASFAGNLAEQLASLTAGEVLYEAYAVPEPLSASLGESVTAPCRCHDVLGCPRRPAIWRIGELRLVSPFVSSSFGDSKLFFKHNLVDRDLEFRPDWVAKIDTLLGAPFYRSIIESGDVWDPEAPPPKVPIHGESMLTRAESFKEREEQADQEAVRSLCSLSVLGDDPDPGTRSLQEMLQESGVTQAAVAPKAPQPQARPCCPFAGCLKRGAR